LAQAAAVEAAAESCLLLAAEVAEVAPVAQARCRQTGGCRRQRQKAAVCEISWSNLHGKMQFLTPITDFSRRFQCDRQSSAGSVFFDA
jgi:hypothetical protein